MGPNNDLLAHEEIPLDKQGDCLYDGGKMIEVKRNPNSRSVNGSFSFYWYYFFGAGFPVLT